MNEYIAYCGLNCETCESLCPIKLAFLTTFYIILKIY